MKYKISTILSVTALAFANTLTPWSEAIASPDIINFPLVRPATLSSACLPYAKGTVKVTNQGNVDLMEVRVNGMPPNTEFDVFVIQVPNFPFGLSWYQGDLQTKSNGKGYGQFLGRFNTETFIVALGVANAPQVHADKFPDALENPATAPVHTYHVGIWFNTPEDAVKASCPGATTPFNGEHKAGIQILNTSTFPDNQGPLLKLKP